MADACAYVVHGLHCTIDITKRDRQERMPIARMLSALIATYVNTAFLVRKANQAMVDFSKGELLTEGWHESLRKTRVVCM